MSHPASIILVHGAFSDASIWRDVSLALQQRGFPTLCPALPMRGLVSDIAYLESVLANIDGPIVLAGHSYGGSVISYTSNQDKKIRALVYVAGFQPDNGETAGELNGRFPGSQLVPESLRIWPTPMGPDIYLKPEYFKPVYAADLDDQSILTMAAGQRPVGAACLTETIIATPRWKAIPSWSVLPTRDRSIPPTALRFMANRAQSQIVEVDSSHAVPASHPTEIVQTILAAAKSVA